MGQHKAHSRIPHRAKAPNHLLFSILPQWLSPAAAAVVLGLHMPLHWLHWFLLSVADSQASIPPLMQAQNWGRSYQTQVTRVKAGKWG